MKGKPTINPAPGLPIFTSTSTLRGGVAAAAGAAAGEVAGACFFLRTHQGGHLGGLGFLGPPPWWFPEIRSQLSVSCQLRRGFDSSINQQSSMWLLICLVAQSQSRPFNVLVSLAWSICSQGSKRSFGQVSMACVDG